MRFVEHGCELNRPVGKVAWLGNPLGQGVMGGLFLGTLLGLLQKEYRARGCANPLPLKYPINKTER